MPPSSNATSGIPSRSSSTGLSPTRRMRRDCEKQSSWRWKWARAKCWPSGKAAKRTFSTLRVCPETGRELPLLEPRLFSFNSPHGACPKCDGLGRLRRPSESAVVRDGTLSIRGGALAVTRASGGALLFPSVNFKFLASVGEQAGFDLDTPWDELTKAGRKAVMRGHGRGTLQGHHDLVWVAFEGHGSLQSALPWRTQRAGARPDSRVKAQDGRAFLDRSSLSRVQGQPLERVRAVRAPGGRAYPGTDGPAGGGVLNGSRRPQAERSAAAHRRGPPAGGAAPGGLPVGGGAQLSDPRARRRHPLRRGSPAHSLGGAAGLWVARGALRSR